MTDVGPATRPTGSQDFLTTGLISSPARIHPVEWVKVPFFVVASLAILLPSQFSFSSPDSLRISACPSLLSSKADPVEWSFVPGAHFSDAAIRQEFDNSGAVGVVCRVLYQWGFER
jgi:hypothetical protein